MKPKNLPTAALLFGMFALATSPLGFAHSVEEHMHGMDDMSGHNHAKPGAHYHAAHVAPTPVSDVPENVSVALSDKPLSDQEGRTMRLKSDVIGDRIVVLTFVYTSCTTVCPINSAIMSELQNKLGGRLDKDVRMVSLTVDPTHDVPSRLKTYSAMYDAKPGWFWLTGTSANVTDALKGFGAYTPNFENHPVIVMIGDGKTGKWSRHYGLSKSDRLLASVDAYLAERSKAAALPARSATVADASNLVR